MQQRTNQIPFWIYSFSSNIHAISVACAQSCWLCTFGKRKLPITRNMHDSSCSRLCLPGLTFKSIILLWKIRFVLEVYRNIMRDGGGQLPKQKSKNKQVSHSLREPDQNQEICNKPHGRILTLGDGSLGPSSQSASFPNKITIPCPSILSIDSLACGMVSSNEFGLGSIHASPCQLSSC